MRTVHLIVKGKVQGVYYRASTKARSDGLGMGGWVKNTREGHVEIVATGNDYAISEFTRWCRMGPPHATVSAVEIVEMPLRIFDEFTIGR